ncbi:TIGR03089 family protein [Solicola gregarius]|uniref:TIGR03089 family protein n=1 Tax=Solicola gregarius TaxID=2908642 RepID=A0AA46YKJ5_9ACTN|nr:TIGR03089 family protein [Solicola gregarius]UYM04033.1 TIGR03089 family protein [Solicola gregarius]
MTIPNLLADAVARDPARPLLTFYDLATGERVELSRATTANWVAKTANMLQDSLAAGPASTVAIDLPPHWERAVWMLAAWEVGCVVHLSPTDTAYDVAVVGPEALDATLPSADEVVALSLRPLGARFAGPLPPGVIDYNAEVLGHGDHFAAYDPPGKQTAAVVVSGDEWNHDDCVAAAERRAAGWRATAPPRVLTGGPTADADTVEILLGALAADGSVVLVAHPRDDRLDALKTDEHVTVVDALHGR